MDESKQEAGGTMDMRHALSLFKRDDMWLRDKLKSGDECTCGSCSLCAYRYLQSLDPDAPQPEAVGSIDKPENGAYLAACVVCKEQKPVMLYPHRLDGFIVGWVFVCADDESKISGADITIKTNILSTHGRPVHLGGTQHDA